MIIESRTLSGFFVCTIQMVEQKRTVDLKIGTDYFYLDWSRFFFVDKKK